MSSPSDRAAVVTTGNAANRVATDADLFSDQTIGRLFQELATAARTDIPAILQQYEDSISSLPDDARERVQSEITDILNELPEVAAG